MPTKSISQKNTTPQIICKNPDDVKNVKALPGYCLEVEFMDRTIGTVFMQDLIFSANAGVFAALKEDRLFKQVFVEYGTAAWPGELDLAPDVMYAAIKKNGQWVLGAGNPP